MSARPTPRLVLRTLVVALLVLGGGRASGLTPSLAFSPNSIAPGGISTAIFTLDNTAGPTETDVAFDNTFPAGLVVSAAAGLSSTCSLGVVNALPGGSTLSLAGARLGAGGRCEVRVNVSGAVAGTYVDVSGAVTSGSGAWGSASASLTVDGTRPWIQLGAQATTLRYGTGTRLTYTIGNPGALVASLNFSHVLPSGIEFAEAPMATNGCQGTLTVAPSSRTLTFFLSPVPAASTCTIGVDIEAVAAGEHDLVTEPLSSTAGSGGRAGVHVVVPPLERVELTARFRSGAVAPGGSARLEFTVASGDRESDATGIAFTDDLDAALSGLAAVGMPLIDPCGAGSMLSGTGVLALTGGHLPPGGTCTFAVDLEVPAGAPVGDYPNATSEVSALVGGSPFVGSPASDTLHVQYGPVLAMEPPGPVGVGGETELAFTLTNASPTDAATGVSFTLPLGEALSGATLTNLPAAGFCGAGSNASFLPTALAPGLTVSSATLPADGSCTFSVTLQAPVGLPAGAWPLVTSEVVGTVGGAQAWGPTAGATLVVVGGPRLARRFVTTPVGPGSATALEYTVSYDAEGGAADATAITFSDDLAATIPGLVATSAPQADVCGAGSLVTGTGQVTLTGGTLAAGGACVFLVDLQVPTDALAGVHTGTGGSLTATVGGVAVAAPGARASLEVTGLRLEQTLSPETVSPGGTLDVTWTLTNDDPARTATLLAFISNLGDAVPGLTAAGLPITDPCGVGSALTLTGSTVRLTGGTVAPGAACSVTVTLQLPVEAVPEATLLATTVQSAALDGVPVSVAPASSRLYVAAPLLLTKEFVGGPGVPGGTVTLRFTVANADPAAGATSLAFSDDLEAALPGMTAEGLPVTDACGPGSLLDGTSVVSLQGGSLAAASTCTFDVTVRLPASAPGGDVTNLTGNLAGFVGGVAQVAGPATAVLEIDRVTLVHSFEGPATIGGQVRVTYTLTNDDAGATLEALAFTHDLDAMLPGLTAVGGELSGVCGPRSFVTLGSRVTLGGASLAPGGTCTFEITLAVPADAAPGDIESVTSRVTSATVNVGAASRDVLTTVEAREEPPSSGCGGCSSASRLGWVWPFLAVGAWLPRRRRPLDSPPAVLT